jgi:hypothetical protein
VARLHPGQGEHPTVAVHPQSDGGVHRTEDQGGRLVHRPLGGVPLVVRKGQRPVGGRRGVHRRRLHGLGEGGVRVVPGHPVEALPQARRLRPLPIQRATLRRSQGILDHGVLLNRLPQPVRHFHLFHQRPRAPLHHIGCHTGLERFDVVQVDAGQSLAPGPSLGLPAHHRGHIGLTGHDGHQSVVDQRLLGDAQFHQVGPGRAGPHPGRHQPGRIGIGPVALRYGHPVDGRQQSGRSGVGGGSHQRPGHQLGGFGVVRGPAQPHQHRGSRIERARPRGPVHPFTGWE